MTNDVARTGVAHSRGSVRCCADHDTNLAAEPWSAGKDPGNKLSTAASTAGVMQKVLACTQVSVCVRRPVVVEAIGACYVISRPHFGCNVGYHLTACGHGAALCD